MLPGSLANGLNHELIMHTLNKDGQCEVMGKFHVYKDKEGEHYDLYDNDGLVCKLEYTGFTPKVGWTFKYSVHTLIISEQEWQSVCGKNEKVHTYVYKKTCVLGDYVRYFHPHTFCETRKKKVD
jgi:hypothetical protein